MDPTVLLVLATLFGCFVLFVVIKKVLKFLLAATALVITALIIGFLFLTGDGSLTKDYLPEEKQERIEAFRTQSKEALKDKAGQVKDAAVEKAEQKLDQAIHNSKEKIIPKIVEDAEQPTVEDREKPAVENSAEPPSETPTPNTK